MNAATVEKKRWTHWTDEELEMLISLYKQGLKYREIAAQIGRPLSTVESKIKIYRETGSLSRPKKRKTCSWDRCGKSYKKVLPPEKWPRAEHFIAAFSRCARLSEAVGRTLDVPMFLDAYRDICQKEEDFRLL
jgi:hypothetical protein